MDVESWLRRLGMEQYTVAFRDNAIDAEVLPRLTADDLKDIGVSAVGHRRKLLDAIAALGAVSAPPEAIAPLAPPPPRAKDEAERRPITVMFCDLVGSTGMAAKMDAEDWRELVGAYLDEASNAVAHYGGHVLKKLGDGIMALFGYPNAQENDAERAARAGLAILRALDDLNANNAARGRPALAARIGLESGPVVVDHTGEVFGDAPNVAARVQTVAEPGTLWITAGVQRQVAGRFVAEDKGPHELKGVAGRPTLYRLVRASGGGRRVAQRSLTPFVGREEDLALLLRRWERARAGEGQFVQIVGEPGLGKSRLVEEFRLRLVDQPHTWVEWSTSQLLQMTPLHPLADWGRDRFGGPEVAVEKRLSELEAALTQVQLDPAEHASLLAPLLDIPLPEARAPRLAPEELRRRQLSAVVAWILSGARAQPLALAFEDLHWADPTTLDLVKALAERGVTASLFILATARPEFRAPWATRAHHAIVSLVPLDGAQVRTMVAAIAERHALSRESMDGVAERTGGVPLFVEEVTRLLLEGGAQAIPPTLQQSLAARLDRLGEAREVAQIGAALGREFSYALLGAVAELPESTLDAALEKLMEADLLFVEGVAPNAVYRFKHALIQDAAYDSLLKSRRQTLHRRAAEALAAAPDSRPELVAHHFTQASQTDAAIEWWGKAGDAALRRSAFQEAIAHLGKAIEMADKETGTEASLPAEKRTKLQWNFGQAVLWSKGFTASDVEAAFKHDESADSIGVRDRMHELQALWVNDFIKGNVSAANRRAEELLDQSLKENFAEGEIVATRRLGLVRLTQGRPVDAKSCFIQTLQGLEGVDLNDPSLSYLVLDQILALSWLGLSLWLLGEPAHARRPLEESLAVAEAKQNLISLANARYIECLFEALRGDANLVLRSAERLAELSRQNSMGYYLTVANAYSAWARARVDNNPANVAQLRDALETHFGPGNRFTQPQFYGLLAEIEAASGENAAALSDIERGLQSATETDQHYSDAFLYRLRGDILQEIKPFDRFATEDAYRTAIRIAEQQSARTYHLLAALPLARLLQFTNRLLEAHDILAAALEGFAPTPELPAIAEARALLAELAETNEWKLAAASRERRLKLQTSYGQAMAWSKGFAAEETKAALARTDELAAASDNIAERLRGHFARWAAQMMGGDMKSAHDVAERFVEDAKTAGEGPSVVRALASLGLTCVCQGQFGRADEHLREALALSEKSWEASARRLHGTDCVIMTKAYLGYCGWYRGDVSGGATLIEDSLSEALAAEHAPTIANCSWFKAQHEMMRGDAAATNQTAGVLLEVAKANNLDGVDGPRSRHRCAKTWSLQNATTERSRPPCTLSQSASIWPSIGFRFTASTPPARSSSSEGCGGPR